MEELQLRLQLQLQLQLQLLGGGCLIQPILFPHGSALLWTPLLAPEIHHIHQFAFLQFQLSWPGAKSSTPEDRTIRDIASGLGM